MLVVLAVTAVLLGIIIVPVIQSFNFTRAAESLSEQQQRGRILVDEIARDVASGTAVADNEGTNGETIVEIPNPNAGGAATEIPLYYSRVDIYKPALGGTAEPGGGFLNTHNGHIDPTQQAPNGQIVVPAAQGATIVRYFLALKNPLQANPQATPSTSQFLPGLYNNPYDGVLTPFTSAAENNPENLYVLRRIEFQPYLVQGSVLQPNTTLFKLDPLSATPAPYLNDPYFCSLSTNDPLVGTNSALQDAQAARINAILKQSTIVTEESRFDMIQPLYDYSTRKPLLDAAGNPRILSLIQFRPSPVSQEPAVGAGAVTLGNETATQSSATFPNLGIAPNVLRTTLGAWSSAVVQVSPFVGATLGINGYSVGTSDYEVLDTRSNAGSLPQSSSVPKQSEQNLLMFNPVATTSLPANLVVFDLGAYANAVSDGSAIHYPFSEAINAAEIEDGPSNDFLTLTDTYAYTLDPSTTFSFRDEVVPFDYNPHNGAINTAFSNSQVGNWAAATKNADNVPQISTSATTSQPGTVSMSPSLDLSAQAPGTSFYDPDFASINELFNVAYYQYANQVYLGTQQMNLRPVLQRFIDLRFEPQLDGWSSPMDPDPTDPAPLSYLQNGTTLSATRTPWIAGWTGFDNVTIVPGSEEVVAPDQNLGPNFGNLVRYLRVTSNPGPNQYVINYTNQQEPQDYSLLDPTFSNPANQHYDSFLGQWVLNTGQAIDPHDPVTMLLQPRFKVGYVQFDSDPNVPLPTGAVKISYKFQFNRPADAISVSYDSREILNVLLSIRSYPQTTNMPNAQTVTLQASAPVKNFIR
jgi:hypothetical protein